MRSIGKIDYMKIDTEDYEMSVLLGAKGMLGKWAIGVIKAEVALDPDSTYHTSIVTIERLPARVRLSAVRLLRSVRRCSQIRPTAEALRRGFHSATFREVAQRHQKFEATILLMPKIRQSE